MSDLKKIICVVGYLKSELFRIEAFCESIEGTSFNQKTTCISDVVEDENKYNYVRDYLNLLVKKTILTSLNSPIKGLRMRVKGENSTVAKIDKYCKKEGKGKYPVNKCLNDLFGARMLTEERLTAKEIAQCLKNNDIIAKCIDSSRGDYKGTHIYIKKDNFSFQWEFQIWYKLDEKNNVASHNKHKQAYTKWEEEK